jgi:predicted nucleotidyltransferase
MYSTRDFETIRDIIISAVPGVDSIFLFGSYAKDTAREQSDIDIAILLEREMNWRERKRILNRLYSDTSLRGYNVDFLFKLAEKYRSDSSLPTISRVISREGRLLWTKN